MITSTEDFISYIKSFSPYNNDYVKVSGAGSHTLLGSFHFGAEDRVMDALQSKAEFPILWMDLFNIDLAYNSGTEVHRVPTSLVFYHNSTMHDFDSEDAAMELCSKIALDVLARLKHDHNDDIIQVDLESFKLRSVFHMYNANLFGYELAFDMFLALDTCYNPLNWNA